MRIAICDDETLQQDYLVSLVVRWSAAAGQKTACSRFPSAESFLFALEDGQHFDALLLDVQMRGMDGVALAKELRASGQSTQIIFITAFPDYVYEGYEVDALNYLIKPVDDEKLFAALDKARERRGGEGRFVHLDTAEGKLRVRSDDIRYAEAQAHYVALVTKENTYRVKLPFGKMEELLGEGFFRCQRSFIVGMRHVVRVTRSAMVLEGGLEIPLSRSLYDAANRAFIDET